MEESYKRYERLQSIINELTNQKLKLSRTLEWYRTHSQYLNEYLDHFIDFNSVHLEITNKTFREKASITQKLLTQLLKDYNTHQWFGLYDYQRLNENLLWLTDYVFEENNQDDLCNYMNNLKF